jgi:hypothetical protein
MLTAYAPHVNTAEAKAVSDEWYEKRKEVYGQKDKQTEKQGTVSMPIGTSWPPAWQSYLSALQSAPIRDTSRDGYINGINRCADMVAAGFGSERLCFITALEIAEGLTEGEDAVSPRTAAKYLYALIALGRYGGAPEPSLEAMRSVVGDLREEGKLLPKLKEERTAKLMERGGAGYIADRIAELRDAASTLPAHSAHTQLLQLQATFCGLILNKPPRRGDAVSWRIGEEVIRHPCGEWEVAWEQEKTGHETETGALWPEICELLDEWILGGRPSRQANIRYEHLKGCYLLTLSKRKADRRLPWSLAREAIGLPVHDLRTVAADYLRRFDPENAANIISTHLGHKAVASGDAYRSEMSAAAGQMKWAQARAIHQARGAT